MQLLGIFLDTETNGLNILRHKVIEIAFKIVDILTGEECDAFHALVALTPHDWEKSDPESLKINGFSWQEILAQGVSSEEIARSIIECFVRNQIKRGEAVFICQNPSFDRAFFAQLINPDTQEKYGWPYHWLDLASMFWVEAIRRKAKGEMPWPWQNGLSKDKIASAFELPSEDKPHRAVNGVNHLLLCYEAVVGFPQKEG